MTPKVLIIIGFLAAVGGVFYLSSHRGARDGGAPRGGAPATPTEVTEISFLYSTEKKDWVETAAAAFQRENPHIKVNLVGRGSLESAQAILDGREKPTVWSPADSAVLRMLESDWATEPSRGPLFATDGEGAPQPLVITPLVFVVWEDRAEVLQKANEGRAVSWKAIHKAVASDQGWPSIGGKPDWGFVKLGHTDPTRSNSGLQALLLATLEYYNKRSGLTVGDLLDPKYQEWVKQLEKGVTRFETSTGTFMTDMVRFGPSRYDIAVVYENLAISQIANAQGRWGNLKVYYPALTLWSDHPAAVLQGPWVTPKQKAAALEWLRYLRSRPVQERALAFGFRPADPSVPLKTQDASNPFTRLAPHGIQVDVPPVAEVPEGPVVRNLLTMWSRVVAAAR
ncbi:substrate-binding domain-containing protein [Pyxidicoccus fallax]|uniref:ABC transporter substrate-binding protein n=1 Tax=Pyxidicoccus fallax TaxID=394095 RepID=A0A848LSD7_9BACT|nr:substrate-binding domain-containing protein [Pyxidicoccus fallax]NMO20878.1 ABC transporter substrate-binding protein [Pyxidicoccus fallax]NPC83742.1 substrate-binding domain-containing protein [Pyxidicoccus fallax]